MFCENCGKENRNDRKFCMECGAKLHDYTKPKEDLIFQKDIDEKQESVEKNNKIQNRFNIALLVLLVLAIACTTISFFVSETAEIVLVVSSIVLYIVFFILIIVKKNILKKFQNNLNNKNK